MPLGDFFDEQYTFALKMNSLGLTDGELGLLNAIMIMNPGQLLFDVLVIWFPKVVLFCFCTTVVFES